MARVLVAGRDGHMKSDAVICLRDMEFDVVCAPSARQVPDHWDDDHASLVLVVASGPRYEYLDLCRRLRARVNAPLVVVGGGDDNEVVQILEAGADDYIAWPVPAKLMAAKLEAVLRRSRRSLSSHAVAKHGELAVNFMRRQVTVGGNQVSLTPIEFRLLSCLLKNAGRVMSCRSLVKEVQGFDCDEREAQETIKVYIRRLRNKIEPNPHQPVYVLNVRGFGYFLETRPGLRSEKLPAIGRLTKGANRLGKNAILLQNSLEHVGSVKAG